MPLLRPELPQAGWFQLRTSPPTLLLGALSSAASSYPAQLPTDPERLLFQNGVGAIPAPVRSAIGTSDRPVIIPHLRVTRRGGWPVLLLLPRRLSRHTVASC
jgi:hypothetical protein